MFHFSQPSFRRSLLLTLLALLLFGMLAWQIAQARTAASDASAGLYVPIVMAGGNGLSLTATAPTASTPTLTTNPTPLTPTATATATPDCSSPITISTVTPTMASVVVAGISNCGGTGVYPIVVNAQLLDTNGFKPPSDPLELRYYAIYSDNQYTDKTQRRIYELADVGTSGGFALARWLADPLSGNVSGLTASLSDGGNIAQGFEEAAWPAGTALGTAPTGYPFHPGQLIASDGDWIYDSGTAGLNGLNSLLDYHIQNRTLMTLPIVDAEAGVGTSKFYHVQRLGNFLLRGYGRDAVHPNSSYLDLVYIGEPAL